MKTPAARSPEPGERTGPDESPGPEDRPPAAPPGPPVFKMGAKLRQLRRARRLTLRELAERAGTSESMISKIENDRATPSLQTLHRICVELGSSVGVMLSTGEPSDQVVFRRGERQMLSVGTIGRETGRGIRIEHLAVNSELLFGSIHIVEPDGDSGSDISHVGEEIGYVLEGRVELFVDGRRHALDEGDSFFFRSELPHKYRNAGSGTARILWINTPPY
ncbi:MAG: helix-turn-helix domain-containing protein [Lautropia sp.]